MNSTFIIIASIIVAIILVGVVITTMYVKAPPSVAFIISGFRKTPRTLIGSGSIKIPLIERLDKLFLGQVNIDVKTSMPVPTNDYIDVTVDAACSVQVDLPLIQVAAKNFLNMNASQIATMVKDNLEGNLREVIGSLTLQNLVTNRDEFSDQISKKAEVDMKERGLKIISCNIQNITDKNGLIQNLGADNVFKIRKDAAITKANAERDIAIAEQEAKKSANDVRIKTETEIAERNNELAIKQAELQVIADSKKAEADAAYEIQMQEQQKAINVKTVDANIEKTKREQVLSQEKIRITENELKAKVNAQADAQKYQMQVASDANKYQTEVNAQAALEQQKREAEAQAYYAEQEAKAMKAKADAAKYSALQEAEGIKAKGIAEAEAIKAKGEAEAYAMDKKAEAYAKYGEAAKLEIISPILPEMAKAVAEPVRSISSVNVYGGDASTVAGKLSSNVPTIMKQAIDTFKSVTGADLGEMVKSKVNSSSNEKTLDDVDFDDTND